MNVTPQPATQRCRTGIEGLDDIVRGGLPRDRMYLVLGQPGVGKTTLGVQFLIAGANEGETGLYITLSESKTELNEIARSHGWDLSKLAIFELSALEAEIKEDADTTFFNPSEVQLTRTTMAILKEVDRIKPKRVVFDSLSELRLLAETSLRYRRQILHLKQYFSGRNCTVLALDDGSAREVDEQMASLAHGVISLTKATPDYGVGRRQIRVDKMRSVNYRDGNHDMLMLTGGVVVFPRLVAAEHHTRFTAQKVSNGVAGLDALVGGGLDCGTSTIFLGPAGSGKSTLTTAYARAAADRGDKVLHFIFDETRSIFLNRASSLGLDLQKHLDSGVVRLEQIDPAEISPGEFAYRIKQGVLKEQVKMVVIDSLNGYIYAMNDQRHLSLHLHEMLSFLNQQGVTTLMVLTQQGMMGPMQSNIDLTYLADSVVMVRYFEAQGTVRQAISVVKKRSGAHERTIRDFAITPQGLVVGQPLTNFQGVLSGTPILLLGDNRTTPANH